MDVDAARPPPWRPARPQSQATSGGRPRRSYLDVCVFLESESEVDEQKQASRSPRCPGVPHFQFAVTWVFTLLSIFFTNRRFPLEEIPQDEKEAAQWLHKLYQEKVKANCPGSGRQLQADSLCVRGSQMLLSNSFLSFFLTFEKLTN